MSITRVPAGVPTGGQFAASTRHETEILLGVDDTEYEDALASLRARLVETDAVALNGDDRTRLFHGTDANPDEIAQWGLLAADGLSDAGMLGTHADGQPITHAVFLTPDPEEAATYGRTVVCVDATDLDLVVVDGPDGYHYACTEPVIPPRRLTGAPRTVTGSDLPDLAFCSEHGYDPTKVEPVANDSFVKPTGGLWLSPVETDADGRERTRWSDYLERQRWRTNTATHRDRLALAPDAKVLLIDSYPDMLAARAWYPPPDPRGLNEHGLDGNRGFDFEALAADGYAAIWLTRRGQGACHRRDGDEPDLYSWDVESVLVLDAAAVRPGG